MKLKLVLLLSASVLAALANAAPIASWTFENSTTTTAGPFAAEVGTGSALGFHSAAATVYSSVVGNGSAKSFSSNTWSVGDYYQFTTSTSGYKGLSFSFDQTGSSTGPANFGLYYSTNGTTSFTQFATYSVLLNGASGLSWGTANGQQAAYSYSFDLSGISGLNNQGSVAFRLIDLNTTSIGNGTPGIVATGGTSRVDNVTISGTVQAVPEPSAFAALGVGALALVRRRRRS